MQLVNNTLNILRQVGGNLLPPSKADDGPNNRLFMIVVTALAGLTILGFAFKVGKSLMNRVKISQSDPGAQAIRAVLTAKRGDLSTHMFGTEAYPQLIARIGVEPAQRTLSTVHERTWQYIVDDLQKGSPEKVKVDNVQSAIHLKDQKITLTQTATIGPKAIERIIAFNLTDFAADQKFPSLRVSHKEVHSKDSS